MTTVFLVRHGMADPVGKWLAGRTPHIGLNAVGRVQAGLLAESMARLQLRAILTSPLERARETAEAIAVHHPDVPVVLRPALTDVDFGEWTGRTIDELANEPAWQAFNADREHGRAPGGESIQGVKARIVGELRLVHQQHPSGIVVLVTHAEPIRCAVAWAGGETLDDVLKREIGPGSVSVIAFEANSARVLGVNLRPEAIAA